MEKEDLAPVPNAEARISTGLLLTEGTLDLEEATEAILKYERSFRIDKYARSYRERKRVF
jgi:hypothetical protein